MRSADNPIGFMKRRHDVCPLGVNQRPDWRGPHTSHHKLRHLRVQLWARRHNHGTLDDIL